MFDETGDLGNILQEKEINLPEPGPNQVLVRVMASPVNPSDLLYARGNYRLRPELPAIAGLEGSGQVVASGRNLASFKPGTHVAFRARGVWADYCLADADKIFRIDADLSFVASSQLTLNGLTAYALLDELTLQAGDTLLVNAAGSSLAYLVIQLALRQRLRVVALVNAGTDTSYFPQSEDLITLYADATDLVNLVRSFTSNQAGCKGFLDAVGGAALGEMLPVMAALGKIIVYGNLSNGIAHISNATVIYKNLTLKGFGIDEWRERQTQESLQVIVSGLADAVATGQLAFKRVRTLSFQNWKQGLQQVSGGNQKLVWVAGTAN